MRIGSLFAGYGGLDMAVEQVFPGASTAWFCEWDEAPSKVLAHHWPGVPNYRDVSSVDWDAVEPVDIIAGGFPCQDVSHAGRRQGLIRDGDGKTRSGLWGEMLKAIDTIRPSFVVAENVRGLLSAEADSDVEPCPFCMGDGGASPMRALGAVLADLADIGYDAAWCGLRAADVGAAHGRFRVFILAWPTADTEHYGRNGATVGRGVGAGEAVRGVLEPQGSPSDPGLILLPTPRASDPANTSSHSSAGFRPQLGEVARTLLPTPTATDSMPAQDPDDRKARGYGAFLSDLPKLLPTPAVNDMGASYTPDEWDAWTARMKAAHGNGNGHGKSLSIEAQRLLPTPQTRDYKDHQVQVAGHRPEDKDSINMPSHQWGDYADAIARWETVIGRAAPAPTEPGPKGNPRLSPLFVEFLMGLPAGHVTDPVIGLTRNQQLKALGNGVVPLQGAAALDWLLSVEAVPA